MLVLVLVLLGLGLGLGGGRVQAAALPCADIHTKHTGTLYNFCVLLCRIGFGGTRLLRRPALRVLERPAGGLRLLPGRRRLLQHPDGWTDGGPTSRPRDTVPAGARVGFSRLVVFLSFFFLLVYACPTASRTCELQTPLPLPSRSVQAMGSPPPPPPHDENSPESSYYHSALPRTESRHTAPYRIRTGSMANVDNIHPQAFRLIIRVTSSEGVTNKQASPPPPPPSEF